MSQQVLGLLARYELEQEIEVEVLYRVTERLGILCGIDEPTVEQAKIAAAEGEAYRRKAMEVL